MGIAAYNRGSAVISRQARADIGIREMSHVPTPRPATWGAKARAKAADCARRIVAGRLRYGLPVDRDTLIGAVVDRTRVSHAVVTAIVDALLSETP